MILPLEAESVIQWGMECPSCQANNPAGQKFCGSCGQGLEAVCPQCQASNPPQNKYCGQCGAGMAITGSITLARSGLITQFNLKALEILGCKENELLGKPFSLFIERTDLVIYFSHLNELISTAKKQSFEISLKHREKNSVYVLLECSIGQGPAGAVDTVQIALTEVLDSRLTAHQLQTQQDLISLIFSVTHNVSTVSEKHLAQSIEDALKKICLFTKADRSIIFGINRQLKRLDPLYEWHHLPDSESKGRFGKKSISLSKIKPMVLKVRQEKTVVVQDLAKLEAQEKEGLLTWHQDDFDAAICHMIYSGKMPVGTISITRKTTDDDWTDDNVALVQFFGNFISHRLPYPAWDQPTTDKAPLNDHVPSAESKSRMNSSEKSTGADAASISASLVSEDLTAFDSWHVLRDMTRPMAFEHFSGDPSMEQQTVFPRDDGLVLISCPQCGNQESVPMGKYDKLRNALTVDCPCGNRFAAVLEKRRTLRKRVQLEGYFSVNGDLVPTGSDSSIWGPIMVIDLSKDGLRFSSEKANLIQPGDILMVRFNLDNTNKALIHKAVHVISVSDMEVGCRFEGADNYDITLGFYFM